MYDSVILPKSYFIDLLKALAAMIEEQKDYLTGLDAAVGDSDHGVNLSIGFRDVMSKLPDLVEKDADIATLLSKSGMALLAKVGGASGPLYGSFFRKMAGPIAGKNEVTFAEFCAMIKAGVDEIKRLGKAQLGDKTMVDALSPAVDALYAGMEQGLPAVEVLENAVKAAEAGRDSVVGLVAKKGRAMRLGERAIGHVDPGTASSCFFLRVMLDEFKKIA
ncbi:MAG: dihydroxyacetone kinase subunit DhaL [Christensenellales bacterium]|jgi:dihydroxyacetone kinase-like protein